MTPKQQALLVLAVIGIAYFLGGFICKRIRMKEHGWRLGIILASLALGGVLCYLSTPKWGIDLRGGVILIYEVDEERSRDQAISRGTELDPENSGIDMNTLIEALTRRVNPSGVREMVIRPYGTKQVEMIIPEVSTAEIALIKKAIENTGFLKFRIVANQDRDREVWDAGELALASDDDKIKSGKFVKVGDEVVGEWVTLERKKLENDELGDYRVSPQGMLTRELVPGELECLAVVDPFSVEGKHLRTVASDFDDRARPSVSFQLGSEGSALFGGLTGSNLPDKTSGSYARLGIVMDDKLLSAPQINSQITSSGVIEGDFAQTEVDFLVRVLRAGKLPAVLHPDPISENQISPLLGEDTIRKGKFAIAASLVGVLVFMLVYYRFAGFVACLALGANLLLIVASMILVGGAFTLPGLAGLVLTVGMSVDANVLIFERIREELRRGATLRMAIRNGFGRATTTIVDANLTTLITAIVLYGIGTDQIKGFAVTLILGIVMSMYTAIFCSRVVFDIAERRGWIKKLTFTSIIGDTAIDFIGKRKLAAAVSAVCIALGIGAVVARGVKLYDIDFRGGTSVQVALNDTMPIENVRSKVADIADDVWVTGIQPQNRPKDTVFKIDTSLEDVNELKDKLKESMSAGEESLLQSHSLEFDQAEPIGQSRSNLPQELQKRRLFTASERSLIAFAQDAAAQVEEAVEEATDAATATVPEATTAEATEAQPVDSVPSESSATVSSDEDAGAAATAADSSSNGVSLAPDSAAAAAPSSVYKSQTVVTFDENISAATLQDYIEKAAATAGLSPPRIEVDNAEWDGKSEKGYSKWNVKLTSSVDETNQVMQTLTQSLKDEPVWLSANKIGGKVAGDMRAKAVLAILVSLLGIVGYIWIRFQRITFGLAAVVALVHDVAITLGAVAISYWAAKPFGFLLLEEFKISLPIVAAFLTIIGYSLNDTIVVFDRIREVKGKNPKLTADMINKSINQTLSRTLLTSVTTFIVVFILYAFGGEGIHGFAFALLIGVIVGTYSSIFVASPSLLWMSEWADKKAEEGRRRPKATTAG
jgi:SecD/SecF fusion protein